MILWSYYLTTPHSDNIISIIRHYDHDRYILVVDITSLTTNTTHAIYTCTYLPVYTICYYDATYH